MLVILKMGKKTIWGRPKGIPMTEQQKKNIGEGIHQAYLRIMAEQKALEQQTKFKKAKEVKRLD